ncbi:hypothetical protein PLICRDRAFT_33967 [Plicaturopsis crispa FD-325 SS-3]|nr:hypothetical protein PLICRDRAFT_33967 [Plicaturopsis crispa FD-325 SS-3]
MVKSGNHMSSESGPSSLKRRKTEDDDSELTASGSKRARTRVSFSCGECHRRKQKCDRQVPCSHCVARKVPELCKAYTPGKQDQDIGVRLARLEHIIELALPQFLPPGTPRSSSFDPHISGDRHRSMSVGVDDDARSQPDEQDPSGGTFQSGKWYGNSASGSVAPASVLEQLQHVVIPGSGQDGHFHDQGRTFAGDMKYDLNGNTASPHDGDHMGTSKMANSLIDSVRQDSESTAADNLKSLVQDCGVSPHKISELLQELPPQRFSGVLIDYYFNAINWTRYPLSERDFRAAYGSICANGVSANPSDARFLPLLFVVLAIAVRLAPENIAGDARQRRLTSLRYYWSSRRSLLIAAAIQPDSLDVVLTRLLSARFLTFDRRITECWSQLGAAVRTAQALGLHRDGAPMGMDPVQVEYRRRIWSYLYHADRSYALVLGRPNAIQDDYTSTLPPLNLEEEPELAQIHNPPPLSSPTPMTFVILRHTLATIIGRMVHHFQQTRTPSHYSDVLALDDDILRFVSKMPSHFAFEPDTSLDESHRFLVVHRFLLITEILFIRISLHRPYILRRLSSDRFARSRAACFESAMKDFEVRQAFRQAVPRETRDALSNAYREFQTAMISGIYLVLDPKGKDADAMHNILDGFLKDHEGVREMDETTRRELKTIEFLKNRAEDVRKTHDTPSPNIDHALVGNGPPVDAQLLLGLQQSTRMSNGHGPLRTSFPSLTLGKSASGSGTSPHSSPSLPYGTTSHIALSPSVQRLQHSGLGESFSQSPSGSGSPTADDESAAQSLLDHWCNTVSSGPLDGTSTSAGSSWGNPIAGSDFSGWGASASGTLLPGDPHLLNGIDGSDWNYWETLVNQIKGGPVI